MCICICEETMVPKLDSRFIGSCSVTARLLQVVLGMSPSQTRYYYSYRKEDSGGDSPQRKYRFYNIARLSY